MIQFLPAFGILALIFVFIKNRWVTKQDVGNEKMARIAQNISEGAMSFLKAEYKILSILINEYSCLCPFFLLEFCLLLFLNIKTVLFLLFLIRFASTFDP